MSPKQAPSRSGEGATHWVTVGSSSTADLLRREVRDGWTGRVRTSDGDTHEATWDGETRCFRDEDDEPIESVEAVDLTRPVRRGGRDIEANRNRTTEVLTLRVPSGTKERLRAVSEREAISVNAYATEAIEWHLRRSRITPKPGPDDLDAGNPFDKRGTPG